MSIWIQHFSNGELKSYTGSSWDTITTLEFNKWYHIRFDFDCNSDTFDVYIDGILTGIDMNFKELATHVDTFQVITTTTGTGKIYIDAVGYSWDSDYIPGENMYTTDTIIPDITESQVAKGDIVDIDFITNTYSEVQMKFVNNDVVQETYIILPRGNNYRMIQSNSFMVDTSITFDEIRFTDYE